MSSIPNCCLNSVQDSLSLNFTQCYAKRYILRIVVTSPSISPYIALVGHVTVAKRVKLFAFWTFWWLVQEKKTLIYFSYVFSKDVPIFATF